MNFLVLTSLVSSQQHSKRIKNASEYPWRPRNKLLNPSPLNVSVPLFLLFEVLSNRARLHWAQMQLNFTSHELHITELQWSSFLYWWSAHGNRLTKMGDNSGSPRSITKQTQGGKQKPWDCSHFPRLHSLSFLDLLRRICGNSPESCARRGGTRNPFWSGEVCCSEQAHFHSEELTDEHSCDSTHLPRINPTMAAEMGDEVCAWWEHLPSIWQSPWTEVRGIQMQSFIHPRLLPALSH